VRVRLGLVAVCAAVFWSVGCGGSSGSSDTAQLRVFVAANGMPNVNVVADGDTLATNLGYGAATAYLTVKVGSVHLQLMPVNGGSAFLDQTISIAASSHQTLVVTGSSSTATLKDGGTTASTGNGYIRVANAATSMGTADVYILPPGTPLATPTAANVAVGSDTNYQVTAAGNFVVFMTAPGTTNVNFTTGPLNLTAGTNQTVIVFDALGGGFNYLLLTDQ